MIKKFYVVVAIAMTTIVLNGCGSKVDIKNKSFDDARRKIENNKSDLNKKSYSSTGTLDSNKGINKEAIKELTNFDEKIKNQTELLKKAYEERIELKKSSDDIVLEEKFKIRVNDIEHNIKNLMDKATYISEKQKKKEDIKEEFKKLKSIKKKNYEDNKNKLKQIFEECSNKIKNVGPKKDVVIQAMVSDYKNHLNPEKANQKEYSKENPIVDVSKKELKEYKDSINAIIKTRNDELTKIK